MPLLFVRVDTERRPFLLSRSRSACEYGTMEAHFRFRGSSSEIIHVDGKRRRGFARGGREPQNRYYQWPGGDTSGVRGSVATGVKTRNGHVATAKYDHGRVSRGEMMAGMVVGVVTARRTDGRRGVIEACSCVIFCDGGSSGKTARRFHASQPEATKEPSGQGS